MVSIRKRYCFVGPLILLTILAILYIFSYTDRILFDKYLPKYVFEVNVSKVSRLVNLNDFAYLLKPSVCEGELAILIVTSYVGHDEFRDAHRKAFSQQYLRSIRMQRVFLLAHIPVHDKHISQISIENESNQFDDLVQGNFNDAYRNLTYKHAMGLRWATTECQSTKFIVKSDDDTVFDLFNLDRYLRQLENESAHQQNFIAGYNLPYNKPIRDNASKWYASQLEYPGEVYPSYVSGSFYITSRQTATKLLLDEQRKPFFWIDDVWITGILRQDQNITIREISFWYTFRVKILDCCIRDAELKSALKCDHLVGSNVGNFIRNYTQTLAQCYNETMWDNDLQISRSFSTT